MMLFKSCLKQQLYRGGLFLSKKLTRGVILALKLEDLLLKTLTIPGQRFSIQFLNHLSLKKFEKITKTHYKT